MKQLITKSGPRLNGPNKNGRIYPQSEFERAMLNYQTKIDEGKAMGSLGHPTSDVGNPYISHIVRSVRVINSRLPRKEKKRLKKTHQYKLWLHLNKKTLVDFEIIPTPSGKLVSGAIDQTFFSMRSVGKVDKYNRVTQLEIQSFDLIQK